MNRYHRALAPSVALAFLLALAACSEAETHGAPPRVARRSSPPSARTTIPVGTTLSFRLDESVSRDSHAPGDRFTATLTNNVTDIEGSVVIPEGSASRWVVERSDGVTEGHGLVVRLESIELRGEWTQVRGRVTDPRPSGPSMGVGATLLAGSAVSVRLDEPLVASYTPRS